MKKKLLPIILLTVSFVLNSCGSSDDPGKVTGKEGIYKIEFSASGEDYTAGANLANPSYVSFFDETAGKDLNTFTLNNDFIGERSYRTVQKVQYITAQGLITSKKNATLKMIVSKDGKKVFEDTTTITVEPGNTQNKTQYVVYTNVNQ